MSRGLGISVRLEPWRMASRHSVSAKMWYSGSAAMLLALVIANLGQAQVNQASACKVAATMLRWVSTAPFGEARGAAGVLQKAIESSVVGGAGREGAARAQRRAFLKRRDLAPVGQRQLVGRHHLRQVAHGEGDHWPNQAQQVAQDAITTCCDGRVIHHVGQGVGKVLKK